MRRSDRRAIVFIFGVVLAFWGGIIVERRWSRGDSDLKTLEEISPLQASSPLPASPNREGSGSNLTENSSTSPLGEAGRGLHTFDPNTADSATLVQEGFAPWMAHNILMYRARGGRYRRAEDLKRVYGMTPEMYESVRPYVRIDKRFQPYDPAELAAEESARRAKEEARWQEVRAQREERHRRDSAARSYPRQEKFKELVQLDLNDVDTTTLKKVPGIASYRARQIIRYRERLGGYVSTEQLTEIEGLPADELAAWFKVAQGHVRRIKVNNADVQTMGRHPYIGFARARAIADYRKKQGRITSLYDLQLLPDFTPEAIERMEPYVEY